MNEVAWIKSLDQDPGPPPRVDVAPAVMRTVQDLPREDDRVLSIAAAMALVLGAASVLGVFWERVATQAPLSALADYFYVVLR